jgi:hypothetical protein
MNILMNKFLLVALFLLVACNCWDECFEDHCPNEVAACDKDERCVDILNDCVEPCIVLKKQTINWACIKLCVAPKDNAATNAVSVK